MAIFITMPNVEIVNLIPALVIIEMPQKLDQKFTLTVKKQGIP